MESNIGHWPSYNPHNFSQWRPSDSSHHSIAPATYYPTHNRTVPPDNQVITTEATNILLRQLFQRSEQKTRPKRPAADSGSGEQASKHPRTACIYNGNCVDGDLGEEFPGTAMRSI